jgi:hypothetical protein
MGGVRSMRVVKEYAHKNFVLSLATRTKLGRQIHIYAYIYIYNLFTSPN